MNSGENVGQRESAMAGKQTSDTAWATQSATSPRVDRLDIQLLRGLAVLLVLAHHAKMPLLHGGYLGVDIFFVISGYLITTLLVRDIDSGTFSFVRFYWRRAWRLLPALYVTLAVCIALAVIFLRSVEMRDFAKQVIGAVTFTGNVALWLQTGYFEQAAELKPLLHVWSLSIEEQYYLLIPAAIVLLPKRLRLGVLCVATLLSVGLCFYLIGSKPGATFYLLPTRAWELGIGTVTALLASRMSSGMQRFKFIGWLALAAIVSLAIQPISKIHPGIDALVCCLCAAALLLIPVAPLNNGAFARAMAFVGDRSYSLYLVHWPIFAFLNGANLAADDMPWTIRLAAASASLVLAWMLHRWVETPCRHVGHHDIRWPKVMWLIVASGGLVCAVLLVQKTTVSGVDYEQRLRSNRGLDASCAHEANFVRLDACQTSPAPQIVVWGDSFAMHLMPGLAALPNRGLAQASRDTCPALLDTALYAPPKFSESWAKTCIKFNESVLSTLTRDFAQADVVALSSPYLYLLGGQLVTASGSVVDGTADAVGNALIKTIAAVRAAGKRVVLVSAPPSTGFDMGLCNERMETGKFSFGGSAGCGVAYDAYRARYAAVWQMLSDVKAKANVDIISFDEMLCDVKVNNCITTQDGIFIYRDHGHFSIEGSQLLGRKMQLVELIERLAR